MIISIKPAGLLAGAITIGITITVSIGCSGGGPPQVSDQNRELCFQHAGGLNYAAYANNARQAASLAERLAANGQAIAAGEAAEHARDQAEEAEASRTRIIDSQRRGSLDADDLRRSARACRDIARDYADYAERLTGQ